MMENNIANAIILGFSDGANIAMRFAMKHQDMVKVLILNGGNLNTDGVKRLTQIPVEIGYAVAKLFEQKSHVAKKNAEMLGLMINDPNIEISELSQITAPTLVICGTNDMIKDSHTKEIAKNLPNSKLSIIKGDHFIANKEFETFNKEVDNFLNNFQ